MTGAKKKIEILDTTLRDGAQMRGIDFSLADKISIIHKLDEFGIQFIEAGWPGSNAADTELFAKIRSLRLESATIVAFGMTCHKNKKPKEDRYLPKLIEAETDVIALVGKSSRFQVEHVLETELEENLRMIKESCSFLTQNGKAVFFDAEHFFDGYKEDAAYSLACLKAAIDGGAIRIILCDTNGGSLPSEVSHILIHVKKEIRIPMGIHTHNDSGLAVANSITAVEHGAIQVQGAVNGYGERCGNADLCVLIPTLQLKMGIECFLPHQISLLSEVSRFVSEVSNLTPNIFQPYVGSSAFCHKGGMHGDGHIKNPKSYQHIDPKIVGNSSAVIISGMAGKSAVKVKAGEFGIELSAEELEAVLAKTKELEADGFRFDGADASLELLMARSGKDYFLPFEILVRRVQSEQKKNKNPKDEAMVGVKINSRKKGKMTYQIAVGSEGPVDALDRAIRKALRPFYGKVIKDVKLIDYKVRVSNARGTRSSVRVLIDFSDGKKTWTTAGCSRDSIGASCQALIDGLEYAIFKAR